MRTEANSRDHSFVDVKHIDYGGDDVDDDCHQDDDGDEVPRQPHCPRMYRQNDGQPQLPRWITVATIG